MKKPKAILSKSEILGIVKRFLKEDAYVPKRDIPLFYKVLSEFPDREFWLSYQLGFQLNAIAWFLSEEGKNKIKEDLALFHLDFQSQEPYSIEETKVGPDVIISQPKKTVRDLLK